MREILSALSVRWSQFRETYDTWPRSKRLSFILVLLLWVGGIVFCWFIINESAPSSAPVEEEQIQPVAGQPSPAESSKEDQQEANKTSVSAAEKKQARDIAEKYVRTYYEEPRESAQDLASKLEPYAVSSIRQSIASSMKVDEPIQIKKLVLSKVKPAFIVGGITYHAIITTSENEEFDYWFSLERIEGEWKVTREETL